MKKPLFQSAVARVAAIVAAAVLVLAVVAIALFLGLFSQVQHDDTSAGTPASSAALAGSDAASGQAASSEAAGSEAASSEAASSEAASSEAAGSEAASSQAASSEAASSQAAGSEAASSEAAGSEAASSEAAGSEAASNQAASSAAASSAAASSQAAASQPQASATPAPTATPTPTPTGTTAAALDIARDSKVLNFVLLGTDETSKSFSASADCDFCMILSVNQNTGNITLVNVDSQVALPQNGQNQPLFAAFHQYGEGGITDALEENLRIETEYYVRVNFRTFMELVDAVGGIDLELAQDEVDYLNGWAHEKAATMGEDIAANMQQVTVGSNHLNGATTILYVRFKESGSRTQRLFAVMQGVLRQLKHLGFSNIQAMISNVLPLVKTNMGALDVLNMLLLVPRFLGASASQLRIPVSGSYSTLPYNSEKGMLVLDFAANAAKLQSALYG